MRLRWQRSNVADANSTDWRRTGADRLWRCQTTSRRADRAACRSPLIQPESSKVFRSSPPITPEGTHSSLQMLAIARAIAACWPRSVGGRRSSALTREKPAHRGTASCAHSNHYGLLGSTTLVRFSHVSLRRLLPPTLLDQPPSGALLGHARKLSSSETRGCCRAWRTLWLIALPTAQLPRQPERTHARPSTWPSGGCTTSKPCRGTKGVARSLQRKRHDGEQQVQPDTQAGPVDGGLLLAHWAMSRTCSVGEN